MTDTAGSTVWKADYEPFGKATIKVGTIENNLRFPGQYFDRETGLHYNYFRDYEPTSGRYIEFDLIGLRGGLNGYLYGNANPLRFTDPLGLVSIGEVITQVGAVGPIDAHTASNIADQSLAAAANSGLPSLHNGPADAYRHCLWSCEMAKAIGAKQAEEVGNIHEKFGKNPPGETCMDLRNNAQGRNAANGPDCAARCRGLLTGGKLQTSPGGTPPSKLY